MISGGAFSWILEHLIQEARMETVMCDMDKLDRGKEVLIIDAFFAQFWFQMTKPLSTKTDEFSEKFRSKQIYCKIWIFSENSSVLVDGGFP